MTTYWIMNWGTCLQILEAESPEEALSKSLYNIEGVQAIEATDQSAWRFDTTGQAYDACQTDPRIQDGHMLIIESQNVIGIASTWPVAVTEKYGKLHYYLGKTDSTIEDVFSCTKEQLKTAIDKAQEYGWPVQQHALDLYARGV